MSIVTIIRRMFDAPDAPPSDRDLADLGLSRTDFTLLVNGLPGTRARMEALAAQFGITPEMIDADRGQALEIAEVCGYCGRAQACQNALELGVAFNPAHCQNAERYAQMAKG